MLIRGRHPTWSHPMRRAAVPVPTLPTVHCPRPLPRGLHSRVGRRMLVAVTVNLLPLSQTDSLLRGKWNGLRAAFTAQAVEAAAGYFVAGRQNRYPELFAALGGQLPGVARTMPPLERITVHGDRARGEGPRPPAAPGARPEPLVTVAFVQSPTGAWYIEGF